MFTHLFKLIWNKKKQNFLLITEMFVSFLVMFAVFTMIVRAYNNYRQPVGFDYEDVWAVSFMHPENIQGNDSVALFHETLKARLKSFPQVVDVGFSGHNFPFAMTTSNSMIGSDDHKGVMTNFYNADENYLKVLNSKMVNGRWFSKADVVSKVPVAVINQKLQDELFEGKDAIGKVVQIGEDRLKIIGVVADSKDKGTYQPIENGIYKRIDSGAARWMNNILVKVRPGSDAAFESKLYKSLSNIIGTSVEIEHLDKKLVRKNKLSLIPMILMLVVGGFLIINVALGLFGVLWYNINKRRSEIGLRRAVGASGNSVSKQLVGESLVLSTLALLIGLFFAIQFPLLKVFDLPASVYMVAIALSVAFIYLLVFLCALYPGRQAAAIYPAIALHEE
jgi:putative ABC transport system permease protein